MSSSTHLCLKQSQKSNWWYISLTFIKILSWDECRKIRKQRGPNHRHKQILIPCTFRCCEQHWQVLHQFFWLMKMFPISFSQILIRHHVHKSNPSKDSLPTFFKIIFCLPGEVLALSPRPITSWILKVMYFRVVFQQKKAGQTAGDCWRKVSGHGLINTPSARWEWPVLLPQLLQGAPSPPCGDRTRWHHRIPAELPTSWLRHPRPKQPRPVDSGIYWRWTRIPPTVPSS